MREFSLNLLSNQKPLFFQIYSYFKDEILQGHLQYDAFLPSIRSCAQSLKVSKNTIENAYHLLVSEGYICNIPKKGYKVVYQGEKNIYDNLSISDDSYNKNIHFDFRYGNIELAAFPFNQWNKVRNTFIANNQSDYMVEGISQGEYILRKELSRLLHESREVVSNPEQIIIGSTPQQLVSLLCQPLEVDKYIIGVENPGYDGARNTFLNHGFQVHAIPLTVDGVSIEELEKSHANVMYVSPSQQFMNKMVMSQDKRQQLIRWVYSNKEVNKMVALEQSGLSLETFICFGNDMNDLPLFQKAHHSVVIGEYEPLLMIAKDQILVDEQVEKNIISKLQELSTIFG